MFTDEELQAAGVRRRNGAAGWIAIVALAALAVFVWAFGAWVELAKARDFHAFESGLARVCAETRGVYVRGECKAPPVSFHMTPLDMLPHADGPSVGPLVPELPKGHFSL